MTDFEVMQRVFDLAIKGGHNVAPNPLVGCVITKNGKIIGSFEGGYTSFNFDVSKHLVDGNNFLIIH